jgi:uncharacterized protein DUF6873
MTTILHDARIPKEYIDELTRQLPGVNWISLDMSGRTNVYESILSHPDIYFFQLDEKTLIYAPSVPKRTLDLLRMSGIELIKGSTEPGSKYPFTSAYNALRIGNILFHCLDNTDPVILENTGNRGIRQVNVAQGYTRCSVLPLNGQALVTSDISINDAGQKEGIDCLYLDPKDIVLPGEKHGFFGGVSGMLPGGCVIVLGDIVHTDDRLVGFLEKYDLEVISVKGLPLYDAGSLICVSSREVRL